MQVIHSVVSTRRAQSCNHAGSRCSAAAQEYNVGKRIEHGYKSIFNNGSTISAVDPKRYSQRFQDFMQKVFV